MMMMLLFVFLIIRRCILVNSQFISYSFFVCKSVLGCVMCYGDGAGDVALVLSFCEPPPQLRALLQCCQIWMVSLELYYTPTMIATKSIRCPVRAKNPQVSRAYLLCFMAMIMMLI